MSRKRKKAGTPEAEVTSEAIPEDILAEGSGPVQAVAHVAIPTDDQEPDPPVRTKRKPRRSSSRDAEMIEAVAVTVAEDMVAEADAEVVAATAQDASPDSIEARATAAVERATRKRKKADIEPETIEAEVEPDAQALADAAERVAAKPARRKRKAKTDEVGNDVEVSADAEAEARADSDAGARADSDTDADAQARADSDTDADAEARADSDTDADVQARSDLDTDARADSDSDADVQARADSDADAELRAASTDADPDNGASTEPSADAEVEGDVAATLPTSAAALDAEQLKQLVEALIFASDKPMTVQRLRQLTRVSDIPRLETALVELAADYTDRGLVLQQVSGGYQFRTRTQWSPWVQQLIAGRPVRLTRAQLETLSIIAYRQPITRPEIDDIRGVDSSATLKLLIDRQLIRILGKKEEVGRPMLYGTTKEFLDFFSLGDLRELPTLREYSELTAESRQVITDRLGDLPDGEGEGGGGEGNGEGGAGGLGGAGGGEGGLGGNGDGPITAAAEPTAADLIARYVAELDADAHTSDSSIGAMLDRSEEANATPDAIADDAAALADAIIAMDPPTDALTTLGVIDSATPDANLASAALASDAEELADAILATASFEELAFDLSDADGDPSPALTEMHEGTLAELDPFALALVAGMARDLATAEIADAAITDADDDALDAVVLDASGPDLNAAEGDVLDAVALDASGLDLNAAEGVALDAVALDAGDEDPIAAEGDALDAVAPVTAEGDALDADALDAGALDASDEDLIAAEGDAPDAVAPDAGAPGAAEVAAASAEIDEAIDEQVVAADSETAAAILAEGSAGIAVDSHADASDELVAAPSLRQDEWPAGSGGVAAARESRESDESDDLALEAGEVSTREPVLDDAAGVDDAVDPVE